MASLDKQTIKKMFAQARQAQMNGQLERAMRAFKKLAKAAPNLPEVPYNLGQIAVKRGDMAGAARYFETALKLRPSELAIWDAYLMMAYGHPNPKNFDILLQRAKSYLDGQPAYGFYAGLAAKRDRDPGEAAKQFERALGAGFKSVALFSAYSEVLEQLGQDEKALAQLERGLERHPQNPLLLTRKATVLQSMGQLSQARAIALEVTKTAPNPARAYSLYAAAGKLGGDDPVIARMDKLLADAPQGSADQSLLASSMAKAMEDTGQYERVFTYLDLANRAVEMRYPYNCEQTRRNGARFKRVYEKIEKQLAPASDIAPIFVTGAPRSGTTLIEQIIASHSDVSGGGELGLLQPRLSASIFDENTSGSAAFLHSLQQACEWFQTQLEARHPGAKHVTDKSISSFSLIGFIVSLLPNARIIVVRRDPRDNALSIYKNQFADGQHRYASNLRNIAFFLQQFEHLIDYWRQQCPQRFYEIQYEDLICAPEVQAKALIEAAGLAWEEQCLSFHENRRAVRTLSVAQVRKPLYSSSIGVWRRYENDLKPFTDAYYGETAL